MPEEEPPGETFPLYQLICDALHVLDAENVCVSLNVPKLDRWYEHRVGVPVTVTAWPEIERALLFRINEMKELLKGKHKPILMRVVGPCKNWLAMRLYKAMFPHAEKVQYVGDGVIDI